MQADNPAADEKKGAFPTTRWSLILSSRDLQSARSSAALAELCNAYWYPLFAFARRTGHDIHDAEDLVQGFFLHLLSKKALDQVGREKGRFRSFLLASFKNYMSVARSREHAAKRGGEHRLISLDLQHAEASYGDEPIDQLTPERAFDARWAKVLLARVTSRVRQEYVADGKGNLFELLKSFLVTAAEPDADSYQQTAQALGINVGAVKSQIFRLRRHFTALLRKEIAQTLLDPKDVNAEMHALCDALVSAGGRLAE
jgi:RNA polymerase sigma-70 factor (ECF subfamily)